MDWVQEQGHSEEEAREIVQRVADTIRRDFRFLWRTTPSLRRTTD